MCGRVGGCRSIDFFTLSAHDAAEFRIRAMFSRLASASRGVIAAGSTAGAVVFAALSPIARGLFSVPGGGVGYVSVTHYPKGFDYWVVAMVIVGAVAGGGAAGLCLGGQARGTAEPEPYAAPASYLVPVPASLARFVLMFFISDHP